METLRQIVNKDSIFNKLFDLSYDSLWSTSPQYPPLEVSRGKNHLYQRIVDRQIHSGKISRYEFRLKWREILYEMIWFNPQLVIISAGFDAHDDDPLADLELIEEDYAWATYAVCLACECCGGWRDPQVSGENATESNTDNDHHNEVAKCISILEGGYNLEAISNSSVEHVKVLFEYANTFGEESDSDIIDEMSVLNLKSDSTSKLDADESLKQDGELNSEESTKEEKVPKEDAEAKEGKEEEGLKVGGEEDENEEIPDGPKRSIEEILASLDQSIGSIIMDALMSLPTPVNQDGLETDYHDENYQDYDGDDDIDNENNNEAGDNKDSGNDNDNGDNGDNGGDGGGGGGDGGDIGGGGGVELDFGSFDDSFIIIVN